MSCRFAERLTAWRRHRAAPVIAGRTSSDLRAVVLDTKCRNRNGAAVGKLSAHAAGEAIDISGFELSNGKSILIKIGPTGSLTPITEFTLWPDVAGEAQARRTNWRPGALIRAADR